MVYCSKCGTLNPETATVCSNCGAALQITGQQQYGPYWRHRRYREEYYGRGGHRFGALFAGIIIILVGMFLLLSQIYGFTLNWSAFWGLVVVFIGLWLIFIAMRINRRRRSTPPPQ
jgi:hypothetical protein